MEFKYSKWRKLDNAALAYPALTGKNHTRVFRFYCQLKESVNEEILQKALDITMDKYPLFQAVLRKGLFWFYLEHRELRAMAQKENKPPCSRLYIPDKKALLLEVSYYKNRINFEVFHALTDGTGAMHFLQELVQNYLILAHPDRKLGRIPVDDTITAKDREEDSFSQYYSSELPKGKKQRIRAARIRGEKLTHDEMNVTEVVIPVKETLAKARSMGVSITVLLTAMFLCAIHEELSGNSRKQPVRLLVPVNLRNYFPSQSMANFFGCIEVGYRFTEETKFEDVLQGVKEQFETELVKEKIAMRMNDYVRLEKNPFLRAVPLEIKKQALMVGGNLDRRSITAVYSNVGIIRFPEEYREYIDRFGLLASTNTMQLCSCSYENEMVLGFTSKIAGRSIERNMQRMLKEADIPVRTEKNDFPGMEKESSRGRKIFQTFTFLCIAAAVLCGMMDFMMHKEATWSLFAAAGCLCTWLIVVVAYRKRRNILKNEMWQLLIGTAICILWDFFTGWRRWSVEVIVPLASLCVSVSIPVIARVSSLAVEEYLFYLVQAGMLGCIPLLFVWTGISKFIYLDVVCGGCSFLLLVWLFIFRRKDTLREFKKKLRM